MENSGLINDSVGFKIIGESTTNKELALDYKQFKALTGSCENIHEEVEFSFPYELPEMFLNISPERFSFAEELNTVAEEYYMQLSVLCPDREVTGMPIVFAGREFFRKLEHVDEVVALLAHVNSANNEGNSPYHIQYRGFTFVDYNPTYTYSYSSGELQHKKVLDDYEAIVVPALDKAPWTYTDNNGNIINGLPSIKLKAK